MRAFQIQRSVFVGLALLGLTSVGCGMGSDSQASASALVTSGLPRCDASLLHPHISVGAAAMHPGKQIVYVDGVMACMDDLARVDQLVNQIEALSRVERAEARPALPQPGTLDERALPRR